jgi:hypothetical protein
MFGHIWSTNLQFIVWDLSCLDIFLSLIGKSYCTFSTKPHQVCGQINTELILTTEIIWPKKLINNKMFVEIKNKSICYLSVLHIVNYSGGGEIELPFENDRTTLFTGVLEMSLMQYVSKFWIWSW